jgi:hypothetical protein
MVSTGSRTLKLSILADVDNLTKNLKSGSTDVGTFGDRVGDFSKKAAAAFAVVAVAAAAMALKIGKETVAAASNLAETQSKVTVIFGESAKGISDFAATASQKLGQSKQQALDAAANFAIFGKAAGLTGRNLVEFSTGFTALASDLASFNNTTPEAAILAIGSALRGEAEPLRKYGVLLDDASLRQAALELGIISTTKNALTPQQKVLAAQKLIYEQTTAAQGDFARTSDGLANKTRILTAELENAKTEIGAALLPVVLQIATALNEKVIPAMNLFIAALTGKDGMVNGIDKSGEAAFQWGLKVRGAIGFIIEMKDELLALGAIIATVFVVGKIVAFVEAISKIVAAMVLLRNTALGAAVATALATGGVSIGTAVTALAAIGATALVTKNLFNLAGGDAGGGGGGGGGMNPIQSGTYLSGSKTFIPDFGGGGGGGGGGSGGGGGGSTVSTNAATSLKDLVGKLEGVSEKIGEITFLFESGALSKSQTSKLLDVQIKQFDVLTKQAENLNAIANPPSFNPGSFRRGEAATMINITVNGAIDSEGTSRTIVNNLNDSFYRGTLGAGALVGAFDK